ncbi:hypothetical protein C4G69_RS01305 [Vibrio parahaemolyticus]|nr:hypothetical protein [Vibrio parahaemolyticus]EJG1033944.1 hypothetical protein [Vibrio parahaemolyticus]
MSTIKFNTFDQYDKDETNVYLLAYALGIQQFKTRQLLVEIYRLFKILNVQYLPKLVLLNRLEDLGGRQSVLRRMKTLKDFSLIESVNSDYKLAPFLTLNKPVDIQISDSILTVKSGSSSFSREIDYNEYIHFITNINQKRIKSQTELTKHSILELVEQDSTFGLKPTLYEISIQMGKKNRYLYSLLEQGFMCELLSKRDMPYQVCYDLNTDFLTYDEIQSKTIKPRTFTFSMRNGEAHLINKEVL